MPATDISQISTLDFRDLNQLGNSNLTEAQKAEALSSEFVTEVMFAPMLDEMTKGFEQGPGSMVKDLMKQTIKPGVANQLRFSSMIQNNLTQGINHDSSSK